MSPSTLASAYRATTHFTPLAMTVAERRRPTLTAWATGYPIREARGSRLTAGAKGEGALGAPRLSVSVPAISTACVEAT